MKKIFSLFLISFICIPMFCCAQSLVTEEKNTQIITVKMVSFPDYFPISYISPKNVGEDILETVFNGAMQQVAKEEQYRLFFIAEEDYNLAVSAVRRGNVDVLLGMYYGTKLYSGLEYIFPAVLNNPIHVVMLPENENKVQVIGDLKKLKGAYNKQERFSDYMLKNFQAQGIKGLDDAESCYRKLFSGEIDYIVGSYYYNYAQICKMGLRGYVTFSKRALWNMPLFIGVSKSSNNHKKISQTLRNWILNKDFTEEVNKSLQKVIKQVEEDTMGIIPPDFIKKDSTGVLTPADELLLRAEEEKGK